MTSAEHYGATWCRHLRAIRASSDARAPGGHPARTSSYWQAPRARSAGIRTRGTPLSLRSRFEPDDLASSRSFPRTATTSCEDRREVSHRLPARSPTIGGAPHGVPYSIGPRARRLEPLSRRLGAEAADLEVFSDESRRRACTAVQRPIGPVRHTARDVELVIDIGCCSSDTDPWSASRRRPAGSCPPRLPTLALHTGHGTRPQAASGARSVPSRCVHAQRTGSDSKPRQYPPCTALIPRPRKGDLIPRIA